MAYGSDAGGTTTPAGAAKKTPSTGDLSKPEEGVSQLWSCQLMCEIGMLTSDGRHRLFAKGLEEIALSQDCR